jgi:hypothetical protein
VSHTHQLEAHYAVLQLDALRQNVVMSFQLTVDLLVAEIRERKPCDADRQRLRNLLFRYREAMLDFDAVVVALRQQCGTDRDDLPGSDDDVTAEAGRIGAEHALAKLDEADREKELARRWWEVRDALYAARHGGEE